MLKLNIHEAKTHLSRYLSQLEVEGKIILCNRNTPIAEIIPIAKAPSKKRPIGLAKGTFQLPESFFDPLPEDIQASFDGEVE